MTHGLLHVLGREQLDTVTVFGHDLGLLALGGASA
jgi:hypothetical protein